MARAPSQPAPRTTEPLPTLAARVRRERLPAPAPDPQATVVGWAVDLASDPETVYLDTETTGLGRDAEIIDLAVVAGDGSLLLESLVRPSGPISEASMRVHGITPGAVEDAPNWPEVHDRLCEVLIGRRVVVYNAEFDRRLVHQVIERHGLTCPTAVWLCAMRAFAAYARFAVPGAQGQWFSLARAAAHFGVQPGTHRAAADARACRGVVLGMAAGERVDPGERWP